MPVSKLLDLKRKVEALLQTKIAERRRQLARIMHHAARFGRVW
jgi:hypothetical protein